MRFVSTKSKQVLTARRRLRRADPGTIGPPCGQFRAPSQRSQTPGWAWVPTSGRIFQQRAHFSPSAESGDHRDAGRIGQRERAARGGRVGQRQRRGDADVGEVDRSRSAASISASATCDHRRRLEARADALVAALDLQRAGHHAAGRRARAPISRPSAGSRHSPGVAGKSMQVHRARPRPDAARARPPPS